MLPNLIESSHQMATLILALIEINEEMILFKWSNKRHFHATYESINTNEVDWIFQEAVFINHTFDDAVNAAALVAGV